MIPFMKESIVGNHPLDVHEETALVREIGTYVNHSTGIQTIFQMYWLADTVSEKGWNDQVLDGWSYKAEYNRRLMEQVTKKTDQLSRGELQTDDF